VAFPVEARAFDGTDEPAGAQASVCPTPAVLPRTPYEEAIVAVWRDVLGRSDIGVTDDFFDLDGDSLHAIRVIARIREIWGVGIRARSFFESPTVAALAAAVAAGSPSERPAIGRRTPDADPLPSFDQQRLWLENQLIRGAAYHVHHRLLLVGPLNVAALQASVRAILVRHEALRTRFPTVDGRPIQVVDDPDQTCPMRIVDLAGGDRAAAIRLADEQAATPFDLAQGPLFRCMLIRVGDTEHILSITAHHIVCDAWSASLFARELAALYRSDGDPHRADLPPLPVQYRDFAVWQRQWFTGDTLERQVSYWRRHLAGAPPTLALPTEWHTLPDRVAEGPARARLSTEDTAALHALCRGYDVTSFMAVLASLATVLRRWSGQRDVVIGVPITGRTDVGTENLIGFFVNTLPLRIDLSGNPTFADLLGRVRQAALGGYAHADAPLDLLMKELKVTRVPGRTPLFQVALNMVDNRDVAQLDGLATEALPAPAAPTMFDLALTASESNGELRMDLEFNGARYGEAMIEVLLGHVVTLLKAALADPTRDILDYPLAAADSLLEAPTDPAAPAPPAVERFADRIAVIDREGAYSYRRLDSAADRVARALVHRGPSPADRRVGIVRRPTAGFVATMLGCLRAAVPFSVVEAGTTESAVPDVIPAAGPIDPVALLRDKPDEPPTAQAATGASGPARDWAVARFHLGPEDRFAVLSDRPGQLISALCSAFDAGATLVMPEHSLRDDPSVVVTWLQENAISVVYASPPVVRAITAHSPPARLPALRYAFIDNSGDLLSHDVEALRRLPGRAPSSAACRVIGVYHGGRDGPPLAAYAVPDGWTLEAAPLRLPLGTELAGAPAVLRYPSGSTGTTGEVAELCFGSHRTGDLGRRWTDGTLEYVGRVEGRAGDPIETIGALRDAPGVRDATVTVHTEADGGSVVFGYVVGPDPTLGTGEIHRRLVAQLPDYLTPQRLFVLDRIPLTPDSEYDYSALPQPDADDPFDVYVAPRTPMERQLTEMLHDLLTVDRIGVYDSFFGLGGSSLLATQLIGRIRETFHVELSLRDLFESATVDRLAYLIVREQAALSDADEIEALLDEIAG
jgi:non-ribosomal peptide synthetase component F/acyl carrier protein